MIEYIQGTLFFALAVQVFQKRLSTRPIPRSVMF